MTRYHSHMIAQLAFQQGRFAPQPVRHRQITQTETLLEELQSGESRTYGDVCERITGYRPDSRADVALSADDLLHDLRCLIEDLSESLGQDAVETGVSVLTVQEVSDRFSVSTKTVDRWRNRGLASRRMKINGRLRVVIPQDTLERFVASHRSEIDRGQTFRQMTRDERQQVILQARILAASGFGLTAVSRRLGLQFTRAAETIRYTLRDYDRKHPENALFADPGRQLSDKHQELAFDLHDHGVPVADLARRFGRSKSSIKAVLTSVRTERLKRTPIEFMDSPEFHEPGAETVIYVDAPDYDEKSRAVRVPSGLPAYLADLYQVPLLNKPQEQHYFRLMNFLKMQACQFQNELDLSRPVAQVVRKLSSLMDEIAKIKSLLIRSNLRLVVSIARRHLNPGVNFFELVSDGNMSLIRAIEKFDYTRGNKFSTYASWAIMKNFARSVPAEYTRNDRFRTGYEDVFHQSDDVRANQFAAEITNSAQRTALSKILEELDGRERKVISCRFGLMRGTEPETLEQVGHRLGVTKERVRQIEVRTLDKMRKIARRKRVEIPEF
ncbi:MAG: sigma-70 family RNA polymerase sigma factor [Fuerstiella sp.]|nr:sigma-70 family RNA polymerase sigma factor [Fuerstiella sp.]